MVTRVEVKPELYSWAVERARGDWDDFVARFPNLPGWHSGSTKPTLKQLQKFATAAHAPIGFFFLPEPPKEVLPLTDFRTVASGKVEAPSPDLLDTIYVCQERQDWYRDFARSSGAAPLQFIGSATTQRDPTEVAAEITKTLGFSIEKRRECRTWAEALRHLVSQCEDTGILVMINGVVGNNPHRSLDPEEFRGFCLSDALAPVIFVNGKDAKSAQMFTLTHEIAHLWLGDAGVSNLSLSGKTSVAEERWCNAVAAEVLVPMAYLKAEFRQQSETADEIRRLCRVFKVSGLVVIRRLFDGGYLSRAAYDSAYSEEISRLSTLERSSSGGGDFYKTEAVRVSKRFATALLVSAYEGNTLFRDASRLLGIKKVSTLGEFAARMGVA